MKHKKTLSLKPFRLTYGAMPFALMAMAASPLGAQSYQLKLSGNGQDALTEAESIISVAHEGTPPLLMASDATWNNYSIDAAGTGVIQFDQSATASNVLVAAAAGMDNGVTFRYSEGIADVDFALGFTAGATNGAEDTTNVGDSGPNDNALYEERWFTRPGDGGQGFQFKGLPEGRYTVYVYSKASDTPTRTSVVTLQTDSDDESSMIDGVSTDIAAGNNPTAFEAGVTHSEQTIFVQDMRNLVIFTSTAEADGSESFSGVGAIQIVEIPFVDTDGDSLPDDWETSFAGDDLTLLNGIGGADNDGDGLSDLEELRNNTNPILRDTDDDGLEDNEELTGSENAYQVGQVPGEAPAGAPGRPTNPLVPDVDGDGLKDGEETTLGTNPHETDTDGDGLADKVETDNMLDPTDPSGENGPAGDPDMDTLLNEDEIALGTNPQLRDTDDDGYDDNVENGGVNPPLEPSNFFDDQETGTDPLNPDTDGDGLKDGDEDPVAGVAFPGGPRYLTNPLQADSDGDFWPDGDEVAAGSDPADGASSPTGVTVVSVSPLLNGGFEDEDVTLVGENGIQSWQTSPLGRTGETVQAGANNQFFVNLDGEGTQIANLFFRNLESLNYMQQRVRGTTSINGNVHNLTLVEAEGLTVSIRALIGMQMIGTGPPDFVTSHGISRIGLRKENADDIDASYPLDTEDIPADTPIDTDDWLVVQTYYTGTEAQAIAAGVMVPIDVYLGLDGTVAGGSTTTITATFTVPSITANGGEFLVLAATGQQPIYNGDPANQGRVTFDDFELILGTNFPPEEDPSVSDISITEAGGVITEVSLTVDNLDTAASYVLKRSADLADGFPTTVGAAFTPPTETGHVVTDPNPSADETFYRIELAPAGS